MFEESSSFLPITRVSWIPETKPSSVIRYLKTWLHHHLHYHLWISSRILPVLGAEVDPEIAPSLVYTTPGSYPL
ncbi:unnamed protein product [Allacma fusca]|uniref:Uncharacterized protein n=1 Tax=Allacma fusca TaxID=39272 RepID=A0A8J2JAT0_9HEXA|nr:unnamed protein product [Allacma fusca]